MSVRNMQRKRQCYQDHGYDGLFDQRRGKRSMHRVPMATAKRVLALYLQRAALPRKTEGNRRHPTELQPGEAGAARRGAGGAPQEARAASQAEAAAAHAGDAAAHRRQQTPLVSILRPAGGAWTPAASTADRFSSTTEPIPRTAMSATNPIPTRGANGVTTTVSLSAAREVLRLIMGGIVS
jgi:hypothetical protein